MREDFRIVIVIFNSDYSFLEGSFWIGVYFWGFWGREVAMGIRIYG